MTSEPNAGSAQVKATGSGETLAAKRYALAVFEIAKENGTQEEWRDAITQIADFMSDSEVVRVLQNTRVNQEAKQNLIQAALGDLPPLALNFARLLVRKSRTALAIDIQLAFEEMLEVDRGVIRVKARAAVPLTDAEREALVRRLAEQTGREVILDIEVDPRLLGGLVVQMGDRLIDASTRGRLQAMRESLTGAI